MVLRAPTRSPTLEAGVQNRCSCVGVTWIQRRLGEEAIESLSWHFDGDGTLRPLGMIRNCGDLPDDSFLYGDGGCWDFFTRLGRWRLKGPTMFIGVWSTGVSTTGFEEKWAKAIRARVLQICSKTFVGGLFVRWNKTFSKLLTRWRKWWKAMASRRSGRWSRRVLSSGLCSAQPQRLSNRLSFFLALVFGRFRGLPKFGFLWRERTRRRRSVFTTGVTTRP